MTKRKVLQKLIKFKEFSLEKQKIGKAKKLVIQDGSGPKIQKMK